MNLRKLIKGMLTGVVLVLITSGIVYAETEVYNFAKSYVNVLRILNINHEKVEELAKQESDDSIAAMTSILSEQRLGVARLLEAQSEMDVYVNSKNELIRASAAAILDVLQRQGDFRQQDIFLTERLLGSHGSISEGDYIVESSKINAGIEFCWGQMVKVSALLTHCFIDMSEASKAGPRRLLLTKIQRQELIKELDELYGTSIKQGIQAGQTKLQVCGAGMREVLADKWLSADE